MKNFIYGDFESKYDRTVFKKIPGKAPEVIFYTQSGKELERLNIEKFDRYDAYAFVAFSVVRVFFKFLSFARKFIAFLRNSGISSKTSANTC